MTVLKATTMIKAAWARLHKAARHRPLKRGGILVFAPNAWFPSMISAPAIIAKTLAERGHAIDVVSCAAERRTCTVMDGMAPLEDRPARRFCDECTARSRDYLARYGLEQWHDTEFLGTADRRRLDALRAGIGPDPRVFVFEGIHIGTLAAGNLSAITKRDVFGDMSDDLAARLRIMVEDGLRWALIARNMHARLRPRYLVYYAEYYPEVIVGLVMQSLGVHVAPITHSTLCGNDFRKIQVLDRMPQVLDMARRLPTWPQWRDLALRPDQVRDVCDDVLTRILGKSVQSFSPGLNRDDEFTRLVAKLRPGLRTIVAFTSSDDEINNIKKQREMFGLRVDATGDIFPDQHAWLRALAEFVARTDHLQLVVRLHPRLGANKRSKGVADYRQQIEAVTGVDCPRIHVVMPESRCSSYDIAQRADLVLTSWSTIGLESVRMGLPAMMAFRGVDIYPAGDFLNYCTDYDMYFERIAAGLAVTANDVLQAFRFTNMHLCGIALDFADLIPRVDDPTLPPFRTPRCSDEVEAFVLGHGIVQERRLAQQNALQGLDATREERAALAGALRRIIHALAFGEEGAPAGLSTGAPPHHGNQHLLLSMQGDDVEASFGSRLVRCTSKSIRRLAELHAELEAAPAERDQMPRHTAVT